MTPPQSQIKNQKSPISKRPRLAAAERIVANCGLSPSAVPHVEALLGESRASCVHCGVAVCAECSWCYGCHRHICGTCALRHQHHGQAVGTNHGGLLPPDEGEGGGA
jgi:hypothetical protein